MSYTARFLAEIKPQNFERYDAISPATQVDWKSECEHISGWSARGRASHKSNSNRHPKHPEDYPVIFLTGSWLKLLSGF